MNQNEEQLFVCDLTAIPAEVRGQHMAAIPEIFQAAQEVQELADGFAFKFLNESGRFKSLATFVEYEQLCCPFEGLAVEIEPYGGPIWLRLTGNEGYKEAMGAALRDMRTAANSIQRAPTDENALELFIDQLTPTMKSLMDNATRSSE